MSAGDQVSSCHEEGGGLPDSFHGEGEGGDDGTDGVNRGSGQSRLNMDPCRQFDQHIPTNMKMSFLWRCAPGSIIHSLNSVILLCPPTGELVPSTAFLMKQLLIFTQTNIYLHLLLPHYSKILFKFGIHLDGNMTTDPWKLNVCLQLKFYYNLY